MIVGKKAKKECSPDVYITTSDEPENINKITEDSDFYIFQRVMPEVAKETKAITDAYYSKYEVHFNKEDCPIYRPGNYYITIIGKSDKTSALTNFVYQDLCDIQIRNFRHAIIEKDDKVTLICSEKDKPNEIIMRFYDSYDLIYKMHNESTDCGVIKPDVQSLKRRKDKKYKQIDSTYDTCGC